MLTRAGTMALRALVELARQPELQLSGPELARRQGLPQPKLEQVLLQLRQAGLVEARRGRSGGYRLCRSSNQMRWVDAASACWICPPQARRACPPAPLRVINWSDSCC